MGSWKMKDFSFWMFNKKTKLGKKFRSYIITTKKSSIGNLERFALSNERTIINKG